MAMLKQLNKTLVIGVSLHAVLRVRLSRKHHYKALPNCHTTKMLTDNRHSMHYRLSGYDDAIRELSQLVQPLCAFLLG
jgi:hypothetical protein